MIVWGEKDKKREATLPAHSERGMNQFSGKSLGTIVADTNVAVVATL